MAASYEIQPGERIAQLIVVPVVQVALEIVSDFTASARGGGRLRAQRPAVSCSAVPAGPSGARFRRQLAVALNVGVELRAHVSLFLALGVECLALGARLVDAYAPVPRPARRACAVRWRRCCRA